MAIGYSDTIRNARLAADLTTVGNASLLRLYSGSRPATGGAIGAAVLLSQHTCGSPFAPAAVAGVQTANAIADGTGLANGTATWARWVTSGGTFIADMSVTVAGGGGDVQLVGTAAIATGQTVRVTSFVRTHGNP